MFAKLNVFEIRKDALKAIKNDASRWSFIFIYYIIPICIALLIHYINYELNTELFGNLIGGISLFAGLLFSIIFVVSNNLNSRKIQYQSQNEEDKRYIENYRNFSNNIVYLISYTVVKSIIIIVLLILADAYFDYLNETANLLIRIIWDLIVFLLYHFLLYIIIILKEMYVMQYEDINKK
ncbi:MAG: hypothetical protein JEY96_19305 [Bacteroidales bacterium]|nr:hypothetical protein [Bacteroidales bacterium]